MMRHQPSPASANVERCAQNAKRKFTTEFFTFIANAPAPAPAHTSFFQLTSKGRTLFRIKNMLIFRVNRAVFAVAVAAAANEVGRT